MQRPANLCGSAGCSCLLFVSNERDSRRDYSGHGMLFAKVSSFAACRGVPEQEAPMSGTGRVAAGAVCLAGFLILTAGLSSTACGKEEDKAQEALQGVYAFKASVEDGVPDESTSEN